MQGTEVTDHGTVTFRPDGTYAAARKWTWLADGIRHVWSLAAAAENLAKGDPVALEFIREREEGLTTELERLVLGLLKGE